MVIDGYCAECGEPGDYVLPPHVRALVYCERHTHLYYDAQHAEVERLRARIAELEAALTDLLWDTIGGAWVARESHYDSMARSDYADAMRSLAERGKLVITHDVGRRVIAVPHGRSST